ncbi:hypothetical protein ACLK1S_26865 [Escherichia coli]
MVWSRDDGFLNKTLPGAQRKENNDYFPLVILAKSGSKRDFWHQWLARSRGIDITRGGPKPQHRHVDDDKRQEKQHPLNDAVEKLK